MLSEPSGPNRDRRGPMAFTFKLEHPDGTPADPPTLRSAVPTWAIGDKIPFGPGKPPLLVIAHG